MPHQNCWNTIGVSGDHSCDTLKTVVHCQNCSVYRQAGRGLLERPIPEGYVTEWTQLLSQSRDQRLSRQNNIRVVNIFQLGDEWLALPAQIIKEVLPTRPIHALPHRNNQVLRGIVNVRGELLLCVSLHALLGFGSPATATQSFSAASPSPSTSTAYLLVIERAHDVWVFEVDKLHGLHHCSTDSFRNVPASGGENVRGFTQAIVPWQTHNLSYLDEDYLFEALQQEAL
ncbi:MAG: chemotaxis protein CheW [Cyanobacteria bacterium J06632_22]